MPSFRRDPLTGVGNMLAFFEALTSQLNYSTTEITVLYVDLVDMEAINSQRGPQVGNQLLRWMALALQDELPFGTCFRLRDDEFAALLVDHSLPAAHHIADRVRDRFRRLSRDLQDSGITPPPLDLVLLYVEPLQAIEVADVLVSLEAAMQQLKRASRQDFLLVQHPVSAEVVNLRATVQALVERVLEMGAMLDQALVEAETDPLTGLPNSRAISRDLSGSIRRAAEQGTSFALLLIDGDNLRNFNKISYAAGDALIRRLAELLGEELRSQDRLARWRMGDEFLILLPQVGEQEALRVAERLVQRVRNEDWQLPVTISVGVVIYPFHGMDPPTLIDGVEFALARAKEDGKDRAWLLTHRQPQS